MPSENTRMRACVRESGADLTVVDNTALWSRTPSSCSGLPEGLTPLPLGHHPRPTSISSPSTARAYLPCSGTPSSSPLQHALFAPRPRVMQHAVASSLLCKLCRSSVAVLAAAPIRPRLRYAGTAATVTRAASIHGDASQSQALPGPCARSLHTSAQQARYRQPAALSVDSDVQEPTVTNASSRPRVRNLKELYDTSGKKKRPILYNNETARTVAGKIRQGAQKLTVVDLYAGVHSAFRLVSSSHECSEQCQILILVSVFPFIRTVYLALLLPSSSGLTLSDQHTA